MTNTVPPIFLTAFTPLAADLPPNVDVDDIVADLADDHVAAPSAVEAKLAPVVEQARNEGIDLEVVVIAENGRHDSQLRDLATAVGRAEPGRHNSRAESRLGGHLQRHAQPRRARGRRGPRQVHGQPGGRRPRTSFGRFRAPQLPWTGITCVLLVGTAAVVGATYYAKVRRARREISAQQPDRKPVSH